MLNSIFCGLLLFILYHKRIQQKLRDFYSIQQELCDCRHCRQTLKALVLMPTNYIISTSGKTSASGVGGIELKSRANHVSHKLPVAHHCCKLEIWSPGPGAMLRRCALLTCDLQKGISECNEDLI